MTARPIVLTAAFFAALAMPSRTQVPAPADPYRDEPFVFERFDTTTTMKADGTGDVVQHVIVRVQSEGVARQFSVLNLAYASAYSSGTIEFVRVHKADGTTVNTPVDEAMEMPAEVTREAPMYSDLKEKHLPVRGLAAGDRLDYQFHTVLTKAQAPGQFWGADHFLVQGGVVLEQSVTLTVPEKTYVHVWSPNHAAMPVTKDGMKVWTWTSSQTKASARDENGKMTAAVVKDADEDADGRKLPSVAWTTFHSWAEVGDWYRSLAEERLQPTAAVRAKAEELTKNAKTPQEQAEVLYRFVATQIRYISLSFGVGRFQPHTPDEVMDHGYGDCKDKDTLLESLLRAKGMTTAPVLIGAGIAPVADVPSPSVFNHAITTVELPGADGKLQRVWLDSTSEVAPFRVLMPVIRDQQALVIPDKAPAALEKTPVNPPYAYLVKTDFTGAVDSNGLLKGHQTIAYRSDDELVWRALSARISRAQWDEAMTYMAPAMGFTGKVTGTDLQQAADSPAAPFRVAFEYQQEKFYNWEQRQIIGVFPWLDLPTIDDKKAPEHDIDLGSPRTLRGESVIALPENYHAELPSANHIDKDFARFDETWKVTDGKVTVNRELTILVHKLPKERWKDYIDFCKQTTDKGEPFITLVGTGTEAKPAVASAASGSAGADNDLETASLRQLTSRVEESERANNWTGARPYAEKARQRFPNEAYVLSMLAYIDAHDKRYDDAIAGYKAELAAHPNDGTNVVRLLAGVYVTQKRYAEAITVLQGYRARKDPAVQQQLAYVQSLSGDYEGALTTTRESLTDKPNDKALQTEEARLLQQLHRNDEVAVAAKRALEGNNDPNQLNSNAYFLAEARVELPLAESSARRSVELFDRMNSTGGVDEANTRAFALSAQMTAAWDTLGDILLIEDKIKAAEPYLVVSWFDSPDAARGNHLAEAYERLGRKDDARRMDVLTLALERTPIDKDDRAAVEAREERLVKAGVTLGREKPTLQAMRTFHLKNVAHVQGSATVRVQLGGAGIQDSSLVAGDAALKPLLVDLQKMTLPQAVPPASPARVLRDAILFCGKGAPECDFVLMEKSGIAFETAPK